MALPNLAMDAVPFTPLTAEFLDDMIENIESLSSGIGISYGAVTTPNTKLTHVQLLSDNGTGTRQTITGTSLTVVAGTSFSYTAGPSNETLLIRGQALIAPSTSCIAYIGVGGSTVGRGELLDGNASGFFNTVRPEHDYDIAANTTVTITILVANISGSTIVANATTDSTAKYAPRISLTAIAR